MYFSTKVWLHLFIYYFVCLFSLLFIWNCIIIFIIIGPEITSMAPASGGTGEMTGVVIKGKNFGTYDIPPFVIIGDIAYPTYWVSDSDVVCGVSNGYAFLLPLVAVVNIIFRIGANLTVYAFVADQLSAPAPLNFSFYRT
jgi:IPT/TIG domain